MESGPLFAPFEDLPPEIRLVAIGFGSPSTRHLMRLTNRYYFANCRLFALTLREFVIDCCASGHRKMIEKLLRNKVRIDFPEAIRALFEFGHRGIINYIMTYH